MPKLYSTTSTTTIFTTLHYIDWHILIHVNTTTIGSYIFSEKFAVRLPHSFKPHFDVLTPEAFCVKCYGVKKTLKWDALFQNGNKD